MLISIGALLVMSSAVYVALASAQGEAIYGRVVSDLTGEPISDVEFRIHRAGSDERQSVVAARSVADGSFGLIRSQNDNDVLVALKPSYAPFRISFGRLEHVLGGVPVIRMARAASLRGHVTDCTTGEGLAAAVRMTSRNEHNIVSHGLRTDTGAFEALNLLPGATSVVVRSGGYGPVSASLQLTQGEHRDLQGPCLEREGRIVGTLVDGSGRAIIRGRLSIEYQERLIEVGTLEELITGLRSSGQNGDFSIGGIVPRVPFIVRVNGLRVSALPLVLNAGDVLDVGSLTVP
ncbi:MAG TPA: carboxypeptidase-like regulatory domain-containing protein [Vicinamibacterales bacterium]